MKNIKEILKHTPLPYDKIKIQRCLKLVTSGLPIHLKNNISFMYLKGNTLYFATKHPAINFELYQKLSDIKMMLRAIQLKKRCLSIKIDNIKCFSIYKKEKKNEKIIPDIKFYIKPLKGTFENRAKNPKIAKKFEEIREIIKNKNYSL
ncbi:MAG: hypothetical protein DSY40_03395 [Nautilia sp.]|nr:MAG: hypothetical protein DSY40_03395 [Nautilia sp.]